MSSGSQKENLSITHAYDAEGVSPAVENLPTKGPIDEHGDFNSKNEKWNLAQDVPLWRRLIGPSRRLVNDVESIYSDEAFARGADKPVDEDDPRQYEIMHTWVEESHSGDPKFFLNFVEKSRGQSKYDSDNVEWIHQKEDVKSFTKLKRLFTTYATTDLVEGIDRLTIGLLRRVQDREERRFSGGYYLGPCALRYDGQKPNDDEDRPAWFANFPYFSLQEPQILERYSASEDIRKRAYPVRTLLQSRYRLEETGKRDSQQSVRRLSKQQANTCIEPSDAQMDESGGGNCSSILYVPQIWILSFHKEKLITSAPIGDKELYGSKLLKKDLSRPSDALSNATGLSLVRIIAEGKENKKIEYMYPINYCDWWFAKKHHQISKDLSSSREMSYDLLIKDKDGNERLITDQNWVEILQNPGLYRKQNSLVLEILMKTKRRPSVVKRVSAPVVSWSLEDASSTQMEIQDYGAQREVELESDMARITSYMVARDNPRYTQRRVESFTRIQGLSHQPDAKSRVPFFEWPLRKSIRHEHEKKKSFRLKYILNKWLSNFMDEYVESLVSRGSKEDDKETAVEHIKNLEPRSLEEYVEDIKRNIQRIQSQVPDDAEDARFAQIDKICVASSDLVGAFIPARVVYGEGYCIHDNIDPQNGSLSSYSETSERNKNPPITPKLEEYATCVDNETISLYRGVLATIVSFLANNLMRDEDFKYFLTGCSRIMTKINTVHLGVFTLRASQWQSTDNDFPGVGVVQKVMITAFKEIMFLHVGLCRYLLSTSASNLGEHSRGIVAFTKRHIDKGCGELEAARRHLISEAADVQTTPDMGPLVTGDTIVILLLDRLSSGVHRHGTVDVIDLYEKVVEKLAVEVDTSASRKLLLEINKTSEELEIVADVFKQQEKVLSLCHVLLDPDTGFKNTEKRGAQFKYESKTIETIRKETRERIADCAELKNRIVRLAKQNVQLVETQQDANNRAILVFTAVTIIFLPLSFVTGLFGMNLRGFIDTSYGASHFWEIAVPLTVVIAVPCLVMAFWHPLQQYFLEARNRVWD